jgi:hypothetical protein
MIDSFVSSQPEFNAFWLIWAAVGVVILAVCIAIASSLYSESDEPFYSASNRADDDRDMLAR